MKGPIDHKIGDKCGIEAYLCFGYLGMTCLCYILTKVSIYLLVGKNSFDERFRINNF